MIKEDEMELLQLEYFLVAAKYQHITKAAESLHVAQPALSQSIKRLENELGVKLFDRKGRNICLNEMGAFLNIELLPIIDSLHNIKKDLSAASGILNNTIKLNILSASELITDIIILYKEANPNVNFRISQNVETTDWDIRISTISQRSSKVNHDIMMKEEILLAVPLTSKFSKNNSLELISVKDSSFISLGNSKPFRSICDNYCFSQGFSPNVVFESDNPSTVRNLIGAGLGIGFWPAYSWGKLKSDKVKLIHISKPNCNREIVISRQNKKANLDLQNDFYEFVLKYLKTI